MNHVHSNGLNTWKGSDVRYFSYEVCASGLPLNDKTLIPLQWCKEINQILKILVGILIVDGVVPLD